MQYIFNRSCAVAVIIMAAAAPFFSQSTPSKKTEPTVMAATEVSSSPAYAELLLRKTDLRSELESLVLDYTEEHPRIREIRFILLLIDRDILRLKSVKAGEGSKLTLALGKLMLRKIELETDLWKLQSNYQDGHPDVKRAKRKVEIYESSVAEILK